MILHGVLPSGSAATGLQLAARAAQGARGVHQKLDGHFISIVLGSATRDYESLTEPGVLATVSDQFAKAFQSVLRIECFARSGSRGSPSRFKLGDADLACFFGAHAVYGARPTRLAMKMSGLPTPFASGITPTMTKPSFW